MESVVRNNQASASPLITAIILIIMLGLLFGVAGLVLAPAVTTSLTIDWIMYTIFIACPVIGLFIITSWAIVKAQRGRGA